MSIPALGNQSAPSGFNATSAQGVVILSWNPAPLATIYYVSRSTDNVTFSELGTATATTYYDSTGTAGTIYYYYVQAGNGTVSSVATSSIAAINLSAGQTTLGNIRLQAQQRINKENSQFYTTQEWNSMLSQSYKELWDILAQKFGDDYFVASPYTFTTVENGQFYNFPADFKALLGVEIALNQNDPNSWITLRQFEFAQRNLYNYPNVYTFYGVTNLKYRIMGNQLMLIPASTAGYTVRIWYVPRPSQLIYDTDLLDGIAGWEEYVVTDTCIKALAKEESDPSIFMNQKMGLLKRIEEAAENRNIGEPQRVTDIRRINFSWGDPGGDGNGSGW